MNRVNASTRLRAILSSLRPTIRPTVSMMIGIVVVIAAAVTIGIWLHDGRTDFQHTIALAPADTQRISYTDWAGVRRELGVDASTPVADLLQQGFEADLTSTSGLIASAEVMQRSFGFSPATLNWEFLAQGPDGDLIVMRLPDDADLDAITDALQSSGFDAEDHHVYSASQDDLVRLGTITPLLANVAFFPSEHLVIASDQPGYLEQAREDFGNDDPDELVAVAQHLGDPLSAAVYSGDYTCEFLAMAQADANDVATADQLISQAGPISPLTGFGLAEGTHRSLIAAMTFESDDQAKDNAQTRATLASGDAPGQGGTFPERFTLDSTSIDGKAVVLAMTAREGSYVVSDLSTGPLLFATC